MKDCNLKPSHNKTNKNIKAEVIKAALFIWIK